MIDEFGVIDDQAPVAVSPIVTLVDGRQVSSSSEEWRHECMARWLLSLDKPKRLEILYGKWVDEYRPGKRPTQVRKWGIEQRQGREVVEALKDTMMTIWNSRRRRRI